MREVFIDLNDENSIKNAESKLFNFFKNDIKNAMRQKTIEYIKKQLGNEANKEQIKHRQKNPTELDIIELGKIEEEINQSFKNKIHSSITDLNQYIKLRKEKSTSEIEAVIKSKSLNILSEKKPISKLFSYASQIAYTHASKYPKIASLYFSYNVTENAFDQYCNLTPKDDPNLLPDIHIDLVPRQHSILG